MPPRATAATTRLRAAILQGVVAILVAGCADAVPSESTPDASFETAPSASPVLDLPLPNGDTDTTQVLLENADNSFDPYRSIGRLDGAATTCTLVLIDAAPGVTSGPAYSLTNGHCVGLFSNDTLTDQELPGATAVFDYFADTPKRLTVPVVRAAYASMKGTDLAVLQLDSTIGDLAAAGYRPWPITDIADLDGVSRDVILIGAPEGVPLADIPEAERYLRLSTCSLDTDPARIQEHVWLWPALRNDCPEVLPGNSGSPLIDIETASLVGILNTTTYKGEAGTPCALGRPCEITEDGEEALPDTSYAMPLGGLAGCFGTDGVFALGAGCGLDPGDGVALTGQPFSVNPSVPDPLTGANGRRTTWATGVEGAGFTHYRYKIVPLETGDCADGAGYGDAVPVSQLIDERLPLEEQRLLLCVVGGPSASPDAAWQTFANATFAVTAIDTTPPTVPIDFSKQGNAKDGWRIEPLFAPPELSMFLHKVGPARTTDCGDPHGYKEYRRIPMSVKPGGPYRYCAIGFDDANNPSAPAGIVLK